MTQEEIVRRITEDISSGSGVEEAVRNAFAPQRFHGGAWSGGGVLLPGERAKSH